MIGKYRPSFSLGLAIGAAVSRQDGVQLLKDRLSVLFGVRHVFLFRLARYGLQAVLRALGGVGAAVLPAYNCISVPEAVRGAGWRPVLTDVAAGDVNVTPEMLERNLPADARVVILTHQFGIPPALDPLLEICRARGIFVLEDAAPAVGARYRGRLAGTFGHAAVISFDLTKVINAGRGGALLTNDEEIARRIAAWQTTRLSVAQGVADSGRAVAWWVAMRPPVYAVLRQIQRLAQRDALYELVPPENKPPMADCTPCSEYVARLTGRQMEGLARIVAARQTLACLYASDLAGVAGIGIPPVPDGAEPVWMQFPIFVEKKEACYEYLLRRGVDLNWTFRYSCGASYNAPDTPNAERAARTVLGLPTYPGLSVREARRICELLRSFVRQ